MKNAISLQFVLIVFASALLTPMYGQKGDYKKAIKENTISGYENFINKHPESEYKEEIRGRLIDLEFEYLQGQKPGNAQKYSTSRQIEMTDNAILKYKIFLRNYPDSRYQDAVSSELKDLENRKKNLAEKHKQEEAEKAAKEKEELENLKKENSIEAYAKYLDDNTSAYATNSAKLPAVVSEIRKDYLDLVRTEALSRIENDATKIKKISEFPFQLFSEKDLTACWGIMVVDRSYNTLNNNGVITKYEWASFTVNPLTASAVSTLKPGCKANFYSDVAPRFNFEFARVNGALQSLKITGSGYIVLEENGNYTVFRN